MTNWRDGSVNFEQRGVEFPDFWSVNAANIVTTKYFRGAVGTPTARVEPASSSSTGSCGTYTEAGRARLLRHRRGRRGLRARADLDAAAPGVQLQLDRSGSTSAPRRRSRSAPASRTTPWSAPRRAWCRSVSWWSGRRRREGLRRARAHPDPGRQGATGSRRSCGCTPRQVTPRRDRRTTGLAEHRRAVRALRPGGHAARR